MRARAVLAAFICIPALTACLNPSPPKPANHAGPGCAGALQSCRVYEAYITGYTYYSNTPPGSAAISHPVLHKVSDGQGTAVDPITMAVGYNKSTGHDVLDYQPGTRFYLPYLQKYFIVEDTCGDGPHPERGPCHLNTYGPQPWLDIWLNGRGLGAEITARCAMGVTGIRDVIQDPADHLPVAAGFICD